MANIKIPQAKATRMLRHQGMSRQRKTHAQAQRNRDWKRIVGPVRRLRERGAGKERELALAKLALMWADNRPQGCLATPIRRNPTRAPAPMSQRAAGEAPGEVARPEAVPVGPAAGHLRRVVKGGHGELRRARHGAVDEALAHAAQKQEVVFASAGLRGAHDGCGEPHAMRQGQHRAEIWQEAGPAKR